MERRNIPTALQAGHNCFHIKLKKLSRYRYKNLPIPNTTHIQYEIYKFLKLKWRLRFISAPLKTVISLWSWAKMFFLLCPYFQINFNERYLSKVFMWCDYYSGRKNIINENCGRFTQHCWLPFFKVRKFWSTIEM